MLTSVESLDEIYLACGYTDLRFGIDGLASIVQTRFQLNPFQNILFLFCGRRTDRLKGLLWQGDGFLLLYKRLENGKFRWPRSEDEAMKISLQQYRWLTEGLVLEPNKSVQKVYPKRIV